MEQLFPNKKKLTDFKFEQRNICYFPHLLNSTLRVFIKNSFFVFFSSYSDLTLQYY